MRGQHCSLAGGTAYEKSYGTNERQQIGGEGEKKVMVIVENRGERADCNKQTAIFKEHSRKRIVILKAHICVLACTCALRRQRTRMSHSWTPADCYHSESQSNSQPHLIRGSSALVPITTYTHVSSDGKTDMLWGQKKKKA